MRRILITLVAVLGLVAVSCGSDAVTASGDLPPTPAPAPTVAGEIVEIELPEFQVETVLVGVSSSDTIMLHALPGVDQPLAGDVAPGTTIEPMDNAFETEDGLIWWQVRAGDLTGWIQPSIAYRGPTENRTDELTGVFEDQGPFASPEDAARAVAAHVGADQPNANIVVVSTIEDPPTATVTVDLLGLGDDALAGYRLIVTARSATGWQPASIIQAPLCARGISAEGLCL